MIEIASEDRHRKTEKTSSRADASKDLVVLLGR